MVCFGKKTNTDNSPTQKEHLVLDAMGVIYQAGDDVEELLIPFIKKNNGITNKKEIEKQYYKASMGEISSKKFWESVQINHTSEDEYLQNHILTVGLIDFLQDAISVFESISCLSNDVFEWSKKLRKRFKLEEYISEWYISGVFQARKPSEEIYLKFLAKSGFKASQIIFVDDREKNLESARSLGFGTILFDPYHQISTRKFSVANNLNEILRCGASYR